MIVHGKNIKILHGNATPDLAKDVAYYLGLPVGEVLMNRYVGLMYMLFSRYVHQLILILWSFLFL